MAPGREDVQEATLQLVHPVYLDVPMMISFLAALEGGIAFEDESTRRSLTGSQQDREGTAKLGLPALGSLLGFDMSGRMGRQRREEETEEVKAVRQHTSASLFNALHHQLHERGYVRTLRGAEVENAEIGEIVELTGAFIGNPLEQLLAFFGQALPYVEGADEPIETSKPPSNPRRSGNPAVRANAQAIEDERLVQAKAAEEQRAGIHLLTRMRADLADSAVHDMVIEGHEGLRAILTLASEFFSKATGEYLRAGNFTALGKVTRVLREDDEVNLTRRTVLGAAKADTAREVVVESVQETDFDLEVFDPIVKAPAVQLLPLAVYV